MFFFPNSLPYLVAVNSVLHEQCIRLSLLPISFSIVKGRKSFITFSMLFHLLYLNKSYRAQNSLVFFPRGIIQPICSYCLYLFQHYNFSFYIKEAELGSDLNVHDFDSTRDFCNAIMTTIVYIPATFLKIPYHI